MSPYPAFSISSAAQTTSELVFGGAAVAALVPCAAAARRRRELRLALFGKACTVSPPTRERARHDTASGSSIHRTIAEMVAA
jgi:hypothetical protein